MSTRDTAHADGQPRESALTYTRYLAIDELLTLQRPLSDGPEHDELLFIVIHQVYELWFKQLLHEIDAVKRSLEFGSGFDAYAKLKRISQILEVCVKQIDVLITMTPLEFDAFRNRLASASGFESGQFRELEAVLGRRDPGFANHLHTDAHNRVEQRMRERSLWDSMLIFVHRCGYSLPEEILERDVSQPYTPTDTVRDVLIAMHRDHHEATHLCELLLDIDDRLREWRFRHVMMVERTIGTKSGTGGSSGSAYLMSTLSRSKSFPELWEIRSAF